MYLKKKKKKIFQNCCWVFKLIFCSTLFSEHLYTLVLLFVKPYSSDHHFVIFNPYSRALTTSFPGENRKIKTVPHCLYLPFLDFLSFLFPLIKTAALQEIFSFWKSSCSIHLKILMDCLCPFFSSRTKAPSVTKDLVCIVF